MGIKQKTVFISYRRTNFCTALAVYQDLTKHGYDCFFDYESIDSGDFEKVIFENIQHRAHFVLILSPSALERLKEPKSVMRREVELAIDEQRNIVPVMMESFDFGSPSAKAALRGKLEALSSYNGLKFVPEYIFAGMEKLRRFLDVELEDVRQSPLSETTEEKTEKRQVKASAEPKVEEKSLTAEEWFERGYAFIETNNYQEAIRCYSKAIELNPKDFMSYNNLGILFEETKHYRKAKKAYKKSIEINPEDGVAHTALFGILQRLGKAEEAKEQQKIARELIEKESEYNRACFESLCGNVDEALALLKIAMEKGQSNKEWAKEDPDLENLRDDPRFWEIVGEEGSEQ
ncbi:MAG: tetratricopeptide repeat protein [Chloroflexi bacterium]|nr:tetratricopeptide repeat protein [Chloroflexota bacterium]